MKNMSNRYNLSNIEAKFKEYLLAVNSLNPTYSDSLQSKTVKNYLSDLRHFTGWLIVTEPNLDITTEIQDSHILNYRTYLERSNIPTNTINRRLSTLRKFFSFCISQNWIQSNPAKLINNIVINPETIPSEKIKLEPELQIILEKYREYLTDRSSDSSAMKRHMDIFSELLVINSQSRTE